GGPGAGRRRVGRERWRAGALQVDRVCAAVAAGQGQTAALNWENEKCKTCNEKCKMRGDEIAERIEAQAVRAAAVAKALPQTVPGRHLAGQLLRCATSPGANYAEARAAESKADFVHKPGIVLKELRESVYWLRVIARAELLPRRRLADIVRESEE